MDKNLLRPIFGSIWIFSGLSKIIGFSFIVNYLQIFADKCMFDFYSGFIRNAVIPNAYLFILLVLIAEVFTGLAILRGEIFAKIGLMLAILMNITFTPLMPPATLIINAAFILCELYILLKLDLTNNYLKRWKGL